VSDSPPPGGRLQYGVLPFLIDAKGAVNVVLITSRGSGRWTIPKGNPIRGKKPHRAAEIEAREEAGLVGKVGKKPVGSYAMWKRLEDHFVLATVVVYPFDVQQRLPTFKEMDQREVQAFPQLVAADMVVEGGLSYLILNFRPEARGEMPA
jgi:8-oxo-dGTP pyrophosphatase MutT (NUDIX family)